MAREIDLEKDSFDEAERQYLLQRPWMLTDELRQKIEDSEVEEASSYDNMNKTELRKELKRRDLDYSNANKDELVVRLQEADASDSEDEDEE